MENHATSEQNAPRRVSYGMSLAFSALHKIISSTSVYSRRKVTTVSSEQKNLLDHLTIKFLLNFICIFCLFKAFVFICQGKKKLTLLFYKVCLSGFCAKASGEDKASSSYLLIQIIAWKSNIASLFHNLIEEPGQRFTCLVIPPQVYPVLFSQTRNMVLLPRDL